MRQVNLRKGGGVIVGLMMVMALVRPVWAGGEYYLPYPGILPDHPLYWLKMVRDRIILELTSEPVGRAKKLLFYADKRINAAKALAEGNQPELAVATAQKAEKYLERAMTQTETAANQGLKVEELYRQLREAASKHEEVLEGIKDQLPPGIKGGVDQAIEVSRRSHQRVSERWGGVD